ncbi:uncharacterized protein LOC131647160 [Vicia villosa]|uniref:uncharacterized protein LOC131647160 n=1 Tax=Vicia villosa TaxID=3911 RepID=UPI00273C0833|nr:uncharacterized protein LOC131647160 [Vicia villosa]
MGSMKKESHKQSKFKHYISTPVRILKKAKDLYVNGLLACSGRLAGSAPVHISVSHLPADTAKENSGERQSLREIFRTAPMNEMRFVTNGERVVPIRNTIGSEMAMQRRQRQRIAAGYKYNRNKMSYQTEVRKMGRIDEDKPCCFEEDESDHSISKGNLVYLYPRSRRINTVVKVPPV